MVGRGGTLSQIISHHVYQRDTRVLSKETQVELAPLHMNILDQILSQLLSLLGQCDMKYLISPEILGYPCLNMEHQAPKICELTDLKMKPS